MKSHWLHVGIILLLTVLPLTHLLQPGLPITHDGQDHVARIANFAESFSEGNFIPRWASKLNWGFGHPILMFLYPLPSYVATVFHWLGFTLVDSTKLVFATMYIFSALAMYWWAKVQFGQKPALLAALLYAFAPYRFVDLTIRGALGEHTAFVFLPLILLGMYGLVKRQRQELWIVLLATSLAGLLLSHNAVSIMMIPICLGYAVYLLLTIQKQRWMTVLLLCIAVLLGVSLSAFFLFPAFLEGKYTLRDIVTQNQILERMVPWTWFFYSPWKFGISNEFSKQVGFIQWLTVVVSLVVLLKTKVRELRTLLLLGLGALVVSLWMMTSSSVFVWESISILEKFQFPWRLLTVPVLVISALGAASISIFKEKIQTWLIIFATLGLLVTTYQMWSVRGYKEYDENFFTSVYLGTTDTGESSPIWSVRFMENQADKPMQLAAGHAEATLIKRTTTTRDYVITATTAATLVENTLYFPGWTVISDDKELPIEFQDINYRGRISFQLPIGTHRVRILFKDTKIRLVSEMLTVAGIGITALLLLSSLRFIFKKKRQI